MLLKLEKVIKYVGEWCLFRIDRLTLAEGEKIGLIGRNGAGKSTLLALIAGTESPDEGYIDRYCKFSRITQLATPETTCQVNPVIARQFATGTELTAVMSGGEKTRYKIAAALTEASSLLLADEPTANLDITGTNLLQSRLREYKGGLIIVSHDRQLLDAVCTGIWEIENGELTVYRGNYTSYCTQKDNERKRQEREYENYIQEKKQLEAAIIDRRGRSVSTRKTPRRMGNSEARLHKMGDQKAKANLDKAVKAIESRLDKLEVKEKPKDSLNAAFDFSNIGSLYSKVVVRGERINKSFGNRVIFKDAEFSLLNGQKVALFGENGCGKTTLLNMIDKREAQIYVSSKARIAYFRQGLDDLELDKSILANVMATSSCGEGSVRQLLAQLLFRREDVFKPAGVLSGGERTRVSLAKMLVSAANVLFLDEPTNYLDLSSVEALEEVLREYQGTLLFVSHDRQFIDKLATHLMLFEEGKLRLFQGNYHQFINHQQEQTNSTVSEDHIILDYRLSEVLSRLSVATAKEEIARLDHEYRELLARRKR